MAKKILREVFIMTLLFIVVALLLAVIFYDYIPINKIVPEPISYKMPEELSDIQNELKNTLTDNETKEAILTYEIDETDLARIQTNKNI